MVATSSKTASVKVTTHTEPTPAIVFTSEKAQGVRPLRNFLRCRAGS